MKKYHSIFIRVLVIAIGFALITTACASKPTLPIYPKDPPLATLELSALVTPHLPRSTETLTLPTTADTVTLTVTPTVTATPEPSLRFAIIGDYGISGQPEADVAALIESWDVELIITTGDNNYPFGAAETIDQNIGQYFHQFIYPYQGNYGEGADRNRFFPTLGNHDWSYVNAKPYLEYFSLPGNERYYDFIWQPVHFFALDSDSREPDGVGRSSDQAQWLQDKLRDSNAVWKVVYMHHTPFSSAKHGPTNWAQWPYKQWGASIVIAGHDHVYERLTIDDFPYITNGLGGGHIYGFSEPFPGSEIRYQANHGAMLVEATNQSISFQFITVHGDIIDSYTLSPK
ncbi:MAG: metallophosphoesterase [Anaerolineae bacterium]|nr:metallophosphoesterase [Anaerolineae bacterium]